MAAAHPTTKQYIQIALVLALLTAVEIALFYIEEGVDAVTTSVTAPALLLLAAIKFVMVVGWFMHVRYEKPLVSRFFAIGFVIAIALYAIVLSDMGRAILGG